VRTTIAVVVGTHDRPARLAQLLRALAEQERAADEVVVVADGSPDSTEAVLAAERARGELPLRTIARPVQGGPATSRDDGWRATEADLIAFTDDDCAPAPGWLAAVERAAEAEPGAFVQGPTLPNPDEIERRGPFSHTISVRGLDPAFPTGNVAYPRSLLAHVDGFDVATFGREPGGEDCDLAWRAIEAGGRPVFAPDALVWHAVDDLGPLGKLRMAARWTRPMTAYARHRELRRRSFRFGLFWKDVHWLFFRALLALALPTRWHALRAWLAYPYLRDVWARGKVEGGGPLLAPYFVLHDLIEITAVARASVRTRVPML
jgi:GT2 family glycosyltransferase